MGKQQYFTDDMLNDRFDYLAETIAKESDHFWSLLNADNADLASRLWDIITRLQAEVYQIQEEMIRRLAIYDVLTVA